jgi:predicted glycosyltransferase
MLNESDTLNPARIGAPEQARGLLDSATDMTNRPANRPAKRPANGAAKRPSKPVLLFYCQHSLGIGHLTRSFALVEALNHHFHVVFLNGGRLPPGLPVPANISLIDLPPLGMDDGHTVVSRDAQHDVAQAVAQRSRLIAVAVQQRQPRVLLVELFPFGRKKFTAEILSLIRQTKRQPSGPAQVVCSLRDILVDARPDQQQHDDRAQWLTDRYFDAVLVHADPALARLEDSFKPRKPLRTPVHYTGYVVPARAAAKAAPRGQHVLVSAGGGIVGERLLRTALLARALLPQRPALRLIAGPFLPEAQWSALQTMVQGQPNVELLRQVPDMVAEMRNARVSISQCGYNTALDVIVSQVPALVVPYATVTENEQSERATRLAALGALQVLDAQDLNPQRLARALQTLLNFVPSAAALGLDGAAQSAHQLQGLMLKAAP